MSKGFDIPSNKHLGNPHNYWNAPQKNSTKNVAVKEPMQWIPIDRNKDGFATDNCVNTMLDKLPFLAVMQYNEHGVEQFFDIVTQYNIADYMGDITTKTRYTHYLPIPQAPVI